MNATFHPVIGYTFVSRNGSDGIRERIFRYNAERTTTKQKTATKRIEIDTSASPVYNKTYEDQPETRLSHFLKIIDAKLEALQQGRVSYMT